MNSIQAFTGLRGVACMTVVFCHYTNETLGSWEYSLVWGGIMAVRFFFVLSGYLLMARGLEAIQPNRETKPKRFIGMNMIYFIIRRFMRIYPAYATAAYFYKSQLVKMAQEKNVSDSLISSFDKDTSDILKLTKFLTHFWSIWPELVFGVFFLPLVLAISSELMIIDFKVFKRSPIKLNIIFIVAITAYLTPVIAIVEKLETWNWVRTARFYEHAPQFWVGIVAGAISFYIRHFNLNPNIQGGVKKFIAEIMIYAFLLRIYLGNRIIAYIWNYPERPLEVLAPYFAALLLVIEYSGAGTSIANLMSTTIFVHIGEISYSVYLLHMFGLKYVTLNMSVRGVDGAMIVLACALLCGQVWYSLIENTSIKFGNFIIRLMKNCSESIQKQVKNKYVKLEEEPALASEQLDKVEQSRVENIALEMRMGQKD